MYIKNLPATAAEAKKMMDDHEAGVMASAAGIAEAVKGWEWSSERFAAEVNSHAEKIGAAMAVGDFLSGFTANEGRFTTLKQTQAFGMKRLTAKLLRGADDTWSGRGNDARRSEADGYRKMAEALIEAL
jgi:hypothetical protein